MKVYVSCHHPDPASELAAALVVAGHEVSSTWHSEPAPRPAADDRAAWSEKSRANLHAIGYSDALVLVAGPDRYPGGKFIEAGFALGAGVGVFTLGGVENGMLHHSSIRHAKDAAELLAMLAES